MEYASEVDEYLAACAEQIREMWRDLRQCGSLSPGEEAERKQNLADMLAEMSEE